VPAIENPEPIPPDHHSRNGRPEASCSVCGLTIISGETVVFDQGELIHVDCHWDHTTRRPLSRAMRWPR